VQICDAQPARKRRLSSKCYGEFPVLAGAGPAQKNGAPGDASHVGLSHFTSNRINLTGVCHRGMCPVEACRILLLAALPVAGDGFANTVGYAQTSDRAFARIGEGFETTRWRHAPSRMLFVRVTGVLSMCSRHQRVWASLQNCQGASGAPCADKFCAPIDVVLHTGYGL